MGKMNQGLFTKITMNGILKGKITIMLNGLPDGYKSRSLDQVFFSNATSNRFVSHTLFCASLRRCCFGLETRVIVKISTHPCYPRNFDWFSWIWSNFFFDYFFYISWFINDLFHFRYNFLWKWSNWVIQNHQFSICFLENFRDWSLG